MSELVRREGMKYLFLNPLLILFLLVIGVCKESRGADLAIEAEKKVESKKKRGKGSDGMKGPQTIFGWFDEWGQSMEGGTSTKSLHGGLDPGSSSHKGSTEKTSWRGSPPQADSFSASKLPGKAAWRLQKECESNLASMGINAGPSQLLGSPINSGMNNIPDVSSLPLQCYLTRNSNDPQAGYSMTCYMGKPAAAGSGIRSKPESGSGCSGKCDTPSLACIPCPCCDRQLTLILAPSKCERKRSIADGHFISSITIK